MVGEEGDVEPVFERERGILLQRLVFILRKYPGLQVFLFSLVEVWLLDVFGC